MWIKKGGNYYCLSDSQVAANTHTKRITKKLTEDDKTVTVEYTLDESIKYFAEFENYEGINTPAVTNLNYSNGSAAYLPYNKFAQFGDVTFSAGIYEFEGYIVGRGTAVGLRFKTSESASSNLIEIPYPISDKDSPGTYKYEFVLQEATTLVMAGLANGGGQAGTPTFDYIILREVTE